MKYDLSDGLHRRRFMARAEALLKRGAKCVELSDRTGRSVSQNAYLHTLIRAMALETGVSEAYAKEVYFKRMANPGLFVRNATDALSGVEVEWLRSSADLTVDEMSVAIGRFRVWAAEQGCWLPEASTADERGVVSFASDADRDAYLRAEVDTSMADGLI